MRYIFVWLTIVLLSCKNEINNDTISKIDNEITFKSFFDKDIVPKILQLDSLYNTEFEKWSELLNFSAILNDMSKEDINHRIMISSLYDELAKMEIDKIPDPFDTPPIIGRTKVLKTFVNKTSLTSESEFQSKEYYDDIKKIISSFNALVYQLNARVKEINF